MNAANKTNAEPTVEDDPWGWWRAQMPIVDRWAYFDHAAVAPLPRQAAEAVATYTKQASEEGDTRWPEWSANNESLRSDFAKLLNCKTTEIALIPNTSFGINAIAESIAWQAGDNIVIPAGEFPSNRFPWLNQQRHGVEVRIIGNDEAQSVDEVAILDAIDERTRLVAASWVGYASGFRISVKAMVEEVHRRGALFFLDAIQGLGVFPLDLDQIEVDFLAADGHKWLLGPEGAGVLMIREARLASLACVPVGWNSVRAAHQFSHASFDIRPAASRYEIGSQTMVGMAALRASLNLFLQIRDIHGAEAIGGRILWVSDLLAEKLSSLGATLARGNDSERHSGIVTFSLPGVEAGALRQAALNAGVVVSCRGIGVRASVHAYNNEAEIDQLVNVVRGFI